MREQNEEAIDQSEFDAWKQDRVTREIFRQLGLKREEINHDLNDANLLLGPNAQKVIALNIGKRDGIDLLLQVCLEDIGDSSHEK